MTTTVYYSDSTPPTAPASITGDQPTRQTALIDATTNFTYLRYYLYQDTSTFEAWTTWAERNKLTTNKNDQHYDGSNVLSFTATYPEFYGGNDNTDNDGFCIIDADSSENNKGAICVVTDKGNIATKTYNFTKTQWDTFWTNVVVPTRSLDGSTKATWDFSGATEQTVSTSIFEGFQKFYCDDYQTGVNLDCRAWSRATQVIDTGTDPNDSSDDVTYGEVDGYPRFVGGDSVYFFWFDGDKTTLDQMYYPYVAALDSTHTLVFTGGSGASYITATIATLVAGVMSQMF